VRKVSALLSESRIKWSCGLLLRGEQFRGRCAVIMSNIRNTGLGCLMGTSDTRIDARNRYESGDDDSCETCQLRLRAPHPYAAAVFCFAGRSGSKRKICADSSRHSPC